jgi:hypothetical protein
MNHCRLDREGDQRRIVAAYGGLVFHVLGFGSRTLPKRRKHLAPSRDNDEWGTVGTTGNYFSKLRKLLAKMEPDERNLVLHMAQKVARRN